MVISSLFHRQSPEQTQRAQKIVSFAQELSQQVAALDQKDKVDLNPAPGLVSLGHVKLADQFPNAKWEYCEGQVKVGPQGVESFDLNNGSAGYKSMKMETRHTMFGGERQEFSYYTNGHHQSVTLNPANGGLLFQESYTTISDGFGIG